MSCQWLSQDDVLQHDRRVLFLKRLLLCFAHCRVGFTTQDNSSELRPWSFPLASIFGHGGRVLIRLNGIPWHDFINFLVFGDRSAHDWEERGVPRPLVKRTAATHALQVQGTQLVESRIGGASTLGRGHMGM